MEVAIQKGILKCISTDTIRQTMRTFDNTPALHRSSFQGEADPLVDWRESCSVLDAAIENIVMDCARRGTSLVLEGVHIVPSRSLIDKWNEAGGLAVGAVLTIPDPEVHRKVIFRRGEQTGKGAEAQITKFNRIRSIHDEMLRLGKECDWLIIEQRPLLTPSPLATLDEFIEQTQSVVKPIFPNKA
jgi:2-phosphoglycerate kinase